MIGYFVENCNENLNHNRQELEKNGKSESQSTRTQIIFENYH